MPGSPRPSGAFADGQILISLADEAGVHLPTPDQIVATIAKAFERGRPSGLVDASLFGAQPLPAPAGGDLRIVGAQRDVSRRRWNGIVRSANR